MTDTVCSFLIKRKGLHSGVCAHACVRVCVGSTGGLVVGTTVYNTSGCEIDPQQCRSSGWDTSLQH